MFVEEQIKRPLISVPQLPLVDHLIGHVEHIENINLDQICILGGQHLLQTTHSMLKCLYKLGLQSKNVFLIGKCYSTNASVFNELSEDGINVSNNSVLFNCHESFDLFYKNQVIKFYDEVVKTINKINPKMIIALDDGGDFLSCIKPDDFKCKNIVGIEQTSAGYNKLSNKPPNFPIINVARSWVKLKYESPIISQIAIQKFMKSFSEYQLSLKRILIVGGGSIGLAIRDKLPTNAQIDIFDTVAEKSSIRSLKEMLPIYDLIIGCTGTISIPHHLHDFLKKDCTLISISSSDREFDAHHLRKKINPYSDCHRNIMIEDKLLLNSGFPINFDGGIHSVPPKYIQLTRALLVAAIIQAIKNNSNYEPKFIDLSLNYQKLIINCFFNKILHQNEIEEFYHI